MMQIQLTQGKVALVDDEDYPKLIKYKWFASLSTNTYYARRRVGKNHIDLHRFILNIKSNEECDHINGDGLDNRKFNLRICTHHQNTCNRSKNSRTLCSSKYKGVYYNKKRKKWQSQIRANQETHYLGRFKNEIDAAKAYDKAAKIYFGNYAKLNFNVNQVMNNE
jgi:hypothetical protein